MKNNVCKSFMLSAIAAAFFVGCSDKDCTAGGVTEGGNAIANVSISGVIQKGPFVAGSKVIAYELDGEGLVQTGKAFVGKTDKNGSFRLNNVSLVSRYAILEGSGYFNNEVTGEKSHGQIILNAIVDLKDHEMVNVNLMTQLEYDRVVYLVTQKGMGVSDAMDQARKELTKNFFGSGESVEFENLDIFGESEEDARLLAISVLTLSDFRESDFSETLAEFSADFEEDGIVDNFEKEAHMADFAAIYMNLAKVRKNVEKFSNGDVPDFEKYVRDFWRTVYKLGACSKDNLGEVKKNSNNLSARSTAYFVCEESGWELSFVNPEYEHGFFTDERDGYTYRTTTIGDQTWFAENLRYRAKDSSASYFCFNNDERYCDLYGVYYPYKSVSCPDGWHVPSIDEWKTLFASVGGDSVAATKLRARGGWDVIKHPQVLEDKDEFGFSAMPAGVYYFGDEGNSAYFRSSDVVQDSLGKERSATRSVGMNSRDSVWISSTLHTTAMSVRCIKDAAKVESPE